MYKIEIAIGDFIECPTMEDLRRCFGQKSEYTEQPNGDVIILHPLNPWRPILAKREEGQ